MSFRRPHALLLAIGVAALALASRNAGAEPYPSRPVHLVVAFVPGGATDTLARQISNDLKEALGQAVVVENRPGANGYLAWNHVAIGNKRPFGAVFNWRRHINGTVSNLRSALLKVG
jgi:tripartite-type tricarboxylate transporter receptor subunit TctC